MSRRHYGDLHEEPRKGATALLALALIVLPTVLLSLSVSADSSSPRLAVYRPSLVPIPPVVGGSPPPVVVEKSAPSAESSPLPPPSPSAAELALKRVNDSLEEERKKREEDKAREAKKRKEEAARQRREEAERKQREEDEERRRLEEARELEAERKREAERLAEARRREQEESEARARAAADAAARAADEAAQAAEAARLANLLDIYKARIIAQVKYQMKTPVEFIGREDVAVKIRVLLHSDGELKDLPQMTRSSGFPEYDDEAIRAVMRAAPLTLPIDEPDLLPEFEELHMCICPLEGNAVCDCN